MNPRAHSSMLLASDESPGDLGAYRWVIALILAAVVVIYVSGG